jgi:hypothetical protein
MGKTDCVQLNQGQYGKVPSGTLKKEIHYTPIKGEYFKILPAP